MLQLYNLYYKYSGFLNFERFDVRTTWNSNKKFEENPVLKLEQRITWSPLSAWSHAQLLSQFSRDWFSEHLTNSVSFFSVLFISLGYFYITFNNTYS
jgi:alpha-N-acetylglucosamine transferase